MTKSDENGFAPSAQADTVNGKIEIIQLRPLKDGEYLYAQPTQQSGDGVREFRNVETFEQVIADPEIQKLLAEQNRCLKCGSPLASDRVEAVQQEAVAWRWKYKNDPRVDRYGYVELKEHVPDHAQCWPLYAAPVQLQPYTGHDSDCAVHNMPAMPNGPCNCSRSRL